jgi:hypothetical protein
MTTPDEPADPAAEQTDGPPKAANDTKAIPTQRTTDDADGTR